jgi:hypothetical protein
MRSFRTSLMPNDGQEKRHSYLRPLRKCLVLGTIIDMKGNADRV